MPNNHSIEFKARQQPSRILPGEGEKPLNNPLAKKARERARYSLDKVIEAARGDRPVLGGDNIGGKWLAVQIKDMSTRGFLLQESEAYFRTREHTKVLGQNPTGHFLVQEKQALLNELGNVTGLRVAGTDIALRSKGQIERMQDNTRITVALPGDLNTLQEMLDLITKKLDGEARDQLLVIENPSYEGEGHFWDEILRSIKILDKNLRVGTDPMDQRAYVDLDALAHHHGIYITEQRSDTVALVRSLDERFPQKLSLPEASPVIPDGSILFVATGTMKKYEELARLFQENDVKARIRPIFELVDMYVSPKESSGTYEGNVAEKARAALDAWHQMDEEIRLKRLQHLGISKAQAFILAEDSGFHFMEPDLPIEDEFGDIRHKIDVTAPFPGVETGPGTIGSNGITNFMEKIRQIFDRRANPNRGVVKKSVLAIMPLEQPKYGDQRMYMVGAEVTGSFTTRPFPNAGTIEIDNYLMSDPIPGLPRGQTEAQMADRFLLHYSPRAVAWQSLAIELGVANGTHAAAKNDFEKQFAAAVVVDFSDNALVSQAGALERMIFKNGFGVIKLDASIDCAKDPQDKVFAKSDGMVFVFDPARAREDFWRNIYMLTSAIVSEQTHDKYKFLKPTYIVNPEGAFDDLMALIYDFHHLGTVPEDPETLIRQVVTVDEAIDRLQQDRLSYRRYDLPGYAVRENPFEIEGRASTKDFNIGIFMSASTENAKYLEDAERLTRGLIEEDIGIVTGGGAFGPMGRSTEIAHAMRGSHKAFHAASNVPHIMSSEGDVRDLVSQFQVSRDIYERMEFMLDRSDAFIITPGGTGTVQELALLALLKQHALDNNDEYAKQKMEGKDIIIVNTKIEYCGKDRGFYDKLLEIIPKEHFARLGIHVVSNAEEAKQKALELRQRKMGQDYVPQKHVRNTLMEQRP